MGTRGELWVVAQFFFLSAVALSPLVSRGENTALLAIPGFALMALGGTLGAAGALHLGTSMSVFPKPVDNGSLVTGGAYRFVRHPIYSGLLLAGAGWALWYSSGLCLLATLALCIFFDAKARREERWLTAKYPEYDAYRGRVRKLIPFVY